MACGTPVACSGTSSLPEIVGTSALTFDPTDIDAIGEAMRRLLTDADLCERLGKAGRQRAEAFTWEQTAAKTMDVYRRAVAGR